MAALRRAYSSEPAGIGHGSPKSLNGGGFLGQSKLAESPLLNSGRRREIRQFSTRSWAATCL